MSHVDIASSSMHYTRATTKRQLTSARASCCQVKSSRCVTYSSPLDGGAAVGAAAPPPANDVVLPGTANINQSQEIHERGSLPVPLLIRHRHGHGQQTMAGAPRADSRPGDLGRNDDMDSLRLLEDSCLCRAVPPPPCVGDRVALSGEMFGSGPVAGTLMGSNRSFGTADDGLPSAGE
jgi:hypothetical protein